MKNGRFRSDGVPRSSSATIFKRMLKHCAGRGMIFAVSMTKRGGLWHWKGLEGSAREVIWSLRVFRVI